ncbi:hypothetical protein DFQ30_002005 [Apophysomyces sp. BC1015]|nr:hypothetical protein DFQ30_002005 [Apophysomyces sp. BC1015]
MTRFHQALTEAREKHEHHSERYCAAQKIKPNASKFATDDIGSDLYVSRRTLCEVSLEYICTLNDIIRTTRALIGTKTAMALQTMWTEKQKNMQAIESLTEVVQSAKPSRLEDDFYETHDGLSYYIQEKLATYHDSLKNGNGASGDGALDSLRSRPSSPTSIIAFPFLNKPRAMQRYSSLDSMLSKQFVAPFLSKTTIKGYLLMKWKPGKGAQADDGVLMRHQKEGKSVVVIDLKSVTVQAADNEKRDFVIQLCSILHDIEMHLQAETALDFSEWFKALGSWRVIPALESSSKRQLTARRSAIPSPREHGTGKTFLSKRPSFSAATIMIDASMLKPESAVNSSNSSMSGNATQVGTVVMACAANCAKGYDSRPIKTGVLSVRETGTNKPSNAADATPTWCHVQMDLLSNGMLHLQSEQEENACFLHQTIQLGTIQRQQIYLLSETIYNTPYCFVIRVSPVEIYCIQASTVEERDHWLISLKLCCIPDVAVDMDTSKVMDRFTYRHGRTLAVRILEGRQFNMTNKDSFHNELFCEIIVDNEKRAVTGKLTKTATPFWREDFVFSDLSKIRRGITINVMNKNSKTDRESRIGSVFVPASQIGLGVMHEEWYDIRKESKHRTFASLASLGYAQAYGTGGELRIGTNLDDQVILPLYRYDELTKSLRTLNNDAIYDMVRKAPSVEGLAVNLVRIYEGLGMAVPWIQSLIDYEVSLLNSASGSHRSITTEDANILFRGNSLLTKAMDVYMKMIGKDYLDEAIGGTVRTLCIAKIHIEVESLQGV